jgi:hypothetical protein
MNILVKSVKILFKYLKEKSNGFKIKDLLLCLRNASNVKEKRNSELIKMMIFIRIH